MFVFIPAIPFQELGLSHGNAAVAIQTAPVRGSAAPLARRQLVRLTDPPKHGHFCGAHQGVGSSQEARPGPLGGKLGVHHGVLADRRLREGEHLLHGRVAPVRPRADEVLGDALARLLQVLGVVLLLERGRHPLLGFHVHGALGIEALVELVDPLGHGRLLRLRPFAAPVSEHLVVQHRHRLAAGHAGHAVLGAQQLLGPLVAPQVVAPGSVVLQRDVIDLVGAHVDLVDALRLFELVGLDVFHERGQPLGALADGDAFGRVRPAVDLREDVAETPVGVGVVVLPGQPRGKGTGYLHRVFPVLLPLRQRAGGGGGLQLGRESGPVFERARGPGPVLPRVGRRHFCVRRVSARRLLELQGNADDPVLPDQRSASVSRWVSRFGT